MGGDVVGGDGDVVVGRDDGAREAAGLLTGATLQDVRAFGAGRAVLLFGAAFV